MDRPKVGDVFEYVPKDHEHTYLAVVTHEHKKRRPILVLGGLVMRGFTHHTYSANIYALQPGRDGLLRFDSEDRIWNGLLDVPFSLEVFRPINASRIDLSSLLKGKKPINFPEKVAG